MISRPSLRGYTLVELMISMVIGMVVAIAAVSFNKVLSVSSRATTSVADLSSIFESIQAVLAVPDTCTHALKDSQGAKPRISNTDLAKIVLNDGSTSLPAIAVNSKYGVYKITGLSWQEEDQTIFPAVQMLKGANELTAYHPKTSEGATDQGGKNPLWGKTVRFMKLTVTAQPIANSGTVVSGDNLLTRVYRFFIVTDDNDGNRMTHCFKSWGSDEVIP